MTERMMKLSDMISRDVERPCAMNVCDLVEHLKAIGNAISDDADHLAVDTHRLRMVRIEAEIAPCDEVTTVTYTLERTADPRLS